MPAHYFRDINEFMNIELPYWLIVSNWKRNHRMARNISQFVTNIIFGLFMAISVPSCSSERLKTWTSHRNILHVEGNRYKYKNIKYLLPAHYVPDLNEFLNIAFPYHSIRTGKGTIEHPGRSPNLSPGDYFWVIYGNYSTILFKCNG